ncbi:MAG: hypothetical protein KDA28_14795, partial [Phycisphaerales bacterium]|nr:hypothetical protein [Phycisphaerales bacterium]
VASPDGAEDSLRIHQDATIRLVRASTTLTVDDGRHLWIQNVRGDIRVNGEPVGPGDAVMAEGGETIEIDGSLVECLAFDLG